MILIPEPFKIRAYRGTIKTGYFADPGLIVIPRFPEILAQFDRDRVKSESEYLPDPRHLNGDRGIPGYFSGQIRAGLWDFVFWLGEARF
jgi:hypothetical protein